VLSGCRFGATPKGSLVADRCVRLRTEDSLAHMSLRRYRTGVDARAYIRDGLQ